MELMHTRCPIILVHLFSPWAYRAVCYRELFIFDKREKSGEGGSEERRRGHASNLARLETAPELKKNC